MKKMSRVGLLVGLLTVVAVSSGWANRERAEETQALSQAKLSLNQAISAALTAVPGAALSAELDDEGDRAVFVVEVVSHGQVYEVTLDSQSGKVLEKKLDPEDDEDHDEADQRD